MTQILGQLGNMVENAISGERELVICIQQGNNRIMTSFVPLDIELDESIYITGDNVSLNIEIDNLEITYNYIEEEFQLLCNDVNYYIALV